VYADEQEQTHPKLQQDEAQTIQMNLQRRTNHHCLPQTILWPAVRMQKSPQKILAGHREQRATQTCAQEKMRCGVQPKRMLANARTPHERGPCQAQKLATLTPKLILLMSGRENPFRFLCMWTKHHQKSPLEQNFQQIPAHMTQQQQG
jgi:hypothetical protein